MDILEKWIIQVYRMCYISSNLRKHACKLGLKRRRKKKKKTVGPNQPPVFVGKYETNICSIIVAYFRVKGRGYFFCVQCCILTFWLPSVGFSPFSPVPCQRTFCSEPLQISCWSLLVFHFPGSSSLTAQYFPVTNSFAI